MEKHIFRMAPAERGGDHHIQQCLVLDSNYTQKESLVERSCKHHSNRFWGSGLILGKVRKNRAIFFHFFLRGGGFSTKCKAEPEAELGYLADREPCGFDQGS